MRKDNKRRCGRQDGSGIDHCSALVPPWALQEAHDSASTGQLGNDRKGRKGSRRLQRGTETVTGS